MIEEDDFRLPGENPTDATRALRVVQWNIERGYQLPHIIDNLRSIDADVIALQEIDMGCDRSGGVDTGREIARALHMRYAFVREFEELRSPLRDAATQGGGFHGNAILSRYDLADVRAFRHRHQPFDWERDSESVNEPRHGARYALTAEVRGSPLGRPLRVYCVHLEVFCGILGRVSQFCDVFADSRACGTPSQIVCGDLNTMAHGIARLSPKYCRDKMRFWSLGSSEARWWADNVLAVREGGRNEHLAALGLPEDVCRDAVNPGFSEPFDIDADITLSNHRGWFNGKLDWMLVRGLNVQTKRIGNHDFTASDHKWLCLEVI
eukprot:m51a1_g5145 hypothetical protein (322) ;mRNA; r:32725-33978